MPETAIESPTSPHLAAAQNAFAPERFGFRRHHGGWIKDCEGIGPVAFAALSWPHAQMPSYERDADRHVPTDALGLVAGLQQQVWGFPPELVVPTNVLAILADTGGSVLIAYDHRIGFNADGWLGFAIGFGARSGTLVSHMLGVREEMRGTKDLGWHLKLLQAHEALRTGHTAAAWTFDPMRGINARLNLEKLGATAGEFTIDKYGVLRSTLYGEDVPSDRLTAHWDLIAPATRARIAQVAAGHYRGRCLADVADIPEVTPGTLSKYAAARPPRLRYRIPGDIDQLMRTDPQAAIRWRQEMRQILPAFLTTRSISNASEATDPLTIAVAERAGDYLMTGLATGADPTCGRISFYVLSRKDTISSEEST